MVKKVWLGSKVRRLRRKRKLAQVELAKRLEISPSYLNLIEHNQRPLTLPLILRLAKVFDIDLQAFSEDDEARLLAELAELLGDPAFPEHDIDAENLRELVTSAPEACRTILSLFRAYRSAREEVQSLGERLSEDTYLSTSTHEMRNLLTSIRSFAEILHDNLDMGPEQRQQFHRILVEQSEKLTENINQMLAFAPGDGVRSLDGVPLPMEEVTDLIQSRGNHFPELEAAAERLWREAELDRSQLGRRLAELLSGRHGVTVEILPLESSAAGFVAYDERRRRLGLGEVLSRASRTFRLARQLALLSHAEELERILDLAELEPPESRALGREVLANYYAAAVMMPYGAYLEAARRTRHDVELLARRFGVSFEQACHRLATLSRPGAEGVPFHFLRVDVAGNISKRFSASGLRIPRYGGACPRWNVHTAFMTPGRIQVQVGRLADGEGFFMLSRMVTKPAAGHNEPHSHFAVGLGCRLAHARELVYSDGLDLGSEQTVVPIGITCRLCERSDCGQRAFPPILRSLGSAKQPRTRAPAGLVSAG